MADDQSDLLQGPSSPANPRPYRSHKFPACMFCRRRKARCSRLLGSGGGPCRLCVLHKVECSTELCPVQKAPKAQTTARRQSSVKTLDCAPRHPQVFKSLPIRRGTASLSPPKTEGSGASLTEAGERPRPSLPGSPMEDTSQRGTADEHTSHVISPALARDVQLLGRCFWSGSPQTPGFCTTSGQPYPYNVVSDNPRDPIVYLSVPRGRTVAQKGSSVPGYRQCETIERILDPHARNLFSL